MAEAMTNRTALITGAAGGFGRSLTRAFCRVGANVIAGDVDAAGLARLKEDLHQEGIAGTLRTSAFDISDYDACLTNVEDAKSTFGSLDILINNGAMGMGVIRDTHMSDLVTIDEVDPAVWDKFISVNLSGAWYLTRAAIPAMKSQGWGRIINVTTSFFTMLRAKFHPYGPAKAALEAMSAGHAAEFAPDGVTVNIVVPGGPSDTPMVPDVAGYNRADLIAPSKMVAPILWLCSDAAGDVTGMRYVAANWDDTLPIADVRVACEAPIGWPDLAGAPVWPGGKPCE